MGVAAGQVSCKLEFAAFPFLFLFSQFFVSFFFRIFLICLLAMAVFLSSL